MLDTAVAVLWLHGVPVRQHACCISCDLRACLQISSGGHESPATGMSLAEQEVGLHGVRDHGRGGGLAWERLVDLTAHVDIQVLSAGVVESTGDRVWSLYARNLANG